mmetsp:Transcript_15463/g.36558  ORF Transcript_15463/g.36558 Transcript_15463/m.36558 type:complete len:894 (-) Transcript_15463:53-2734(-)
MAAMRAIVLPWLAGVAAANMNGKYSVASGDRQDVGFNDDFASKGHEFFDVWSPEIATHYGEVFWTDLGNQPLPTEIVQRFKGKVIAITGYEMDQVMVQPTGQPGKNPKQDVSVPINWAYNHHYMMMMTGEHSEVRKVPAAPGDPMAHGAASKWIAIDRPSAATREDPSIPTSHLFSEGNGGESRKSFHGYPEGYAQLLESPDLWHITPMQVDTRNRDCGVSPADIGKCSSPFVPGPEPRQTRWGLGVPKVTNYSGLLECPCNSRFGGDPMFYPDSKTHMVERKYTLVGMGSCSSQQVVQNASDCFAAAPQLGINGSQFINQTVADNKLPPGCSVMRLQNDSVVVNFNTKEGAEGKCSSSSERSGEGTSPVGVKIQISLDGNGMYKMSPKGQFCSKNRDAKIQSFHMQGSSVLAAREARNRCLQFCWNDATCWGCSVDCDSEPYAYGALLTACQWNAIKSCGSIEAWAGSIEGDVSEKQPHGGSAQITLSGPASGWFGAGFNAEAMADSPYTLVVNDAGVTERKIGTCGSEAEHCPGDLLAPSIRVISNSVVAGVRTAVVQRALVGLSKNHYSFNPFADETIHFITAVGQSQTFAYHKAHGPTQVALTSVGSSSCICDQGLVGRLCATGGVNCTEFVKDCAAAPAGDLFTQRNPTCNSRQYSGGLHCCHHQYIMLDADQEVRPELLRYHMKMRFWFQEYRASTGSKASHANLPRIYYQTEANAGEYDIPPAFARGHPIVGYPEWPPNKPTPGTSCTGNCPDGADCECVHTITYHWTVSNIRLIYAGGHCHAPSCLSIELYHNLSGTPQLLCRQLPKFGQGNFPKDKWDEAGYATLPPCLWSDEDPSLDNSVWLPANTPMISVKKNRNTFLGHYGEMASWQMRGVNFPAKPPTFV